MKAQLRKLYRRGRSAAVYRFLSYDSVQLGQAIEQLGVKAGDRVMLHSALNADNGFTGKNIEIIQTLKDLITKEGLLVMPSMTYGDSSRAFLQRDGVLKVRRSASKMGLLSEIFRRNKETLRSWSPIHPLLAWGKEAQEFIAGHENCQYSFGGGSPFEKLLKQDAKVLCFDVGFEYITFTHFVEDQVKDKLGFPLYDANTITGTVVDPDGNELSVDCYVLGDQSRKLRREERLIDQLEKRKLLKKGRIGNTRLLLVNCQDILTTAEDMLANNESFFDTPE